jgi:hypothetical protein
MKYIIDLIIALLLVLLLLLLNYYYWNSLKRDRAYINKWQSKFRSFMLPPSSGSKYCHKTALCSSEPSVVSPSSQLFLICCRRSKQRCEGSIHVKLTVTFLLYSIMEGLKWSSRDTTKLSLRWGLSTRHLGEGKGVSLTTYTTICNLPV